MGKITTVVMIVFLITLVLFSWIQLVNDFEVNYIDTNISKAKGMNETFKEDYDNVETLNETFKPIQDATATLTNEEEGWFGGLGDLAISIPQVVIKLPSAFFSSVGMLISIVQDVGDMIGIPPEVVTMAIAALSIGAILIIVEFFRRYPV